MKKIVLITLVFASLLTACGQAKAIVPTKEQKASQAILEQYFSSDKAGDIDKHMSLYADNIVWMDYGLNDGPYDKKGLDAMRRMSTSGVKEKGQSYFITPDGRFAVIQMELTMQSTFSSKWVTAPATGVLEFKDGKIVNESWYYDGEVYRQ